MLNINIQRQGNIDLHDIFIINPLFKLYFPTHCLKTTETLLDFLRFVTMVKYYWVEFLM